MNTVHVALVGNPNAGKTTIFNALTGLHQHVGNWPGKTIERKTGRFVYRTQAIELVDLPGTYSLNPFSAEELITREYLLTEKPDVVICVVDALNLERNLYLTVQVLELGVPVVLALNMMDGARARGLQIDIAGLHKALHTPIVPTVASHNQGMDELMQTVLQIARAKAFTPEVKHVAA